MCGSTNGARRQAFAIAAAFFSELTAVQIGEKTEVKGATRRNIEFIQSLGGPEAPADVVALADAEDAALTLVRDVQLSQKAVIESLLSSPSGAVYSDGSLVKDYVAALNNLAAADAVRVKAQAAFDAEAAKYSGVSDADPVLQ